jgi:uncharacterized protein DUF955
VKKLPVQIATPNSAPDVTDEVRRLLRAAGVRNQLPTPKTDILACARLVESGELDLADYEATMIDKTVGFFHKAFSKVLGFLDRRSEIIYVDPSIHDSRKLFVTYHEVAHSILPWQHIVYTEDDDSTLGAEWTSECKNHFESEANFGAAELLFQCERFEDEAKDHALSIESALYLANKYDASCHAALRRFVERNHRPCLLLVLKKTSRENADGKASYFVAYSIPSSPFTAEFGEPLDMKFVNPHEHLGKILNNGDHGKIVLSDLKGFSRTCMVESFSNHFRIFVLIYPKHDQHPRISVRFRI